MTGNNLKELPFEELLKRLRTAQKNLALSQLYHQGAEVVQQNKQQLEKVQKAIVDKRGDPIPWNSKS